MDDISRELPANTPVIVGIGLCNQKMADASEAQEAIALMVSALRRAALDAGSETLLTDCDAILVPQGMWAYSDPARLIARRVGATRAQTVFAKLGILQQTLLGEASRRIAEREADVIIVAGGEARYRQLMAQINDIEIEDTAQSETPDQVMEPSEEMWLEAESNAGLAMPVGFYALMESARRYARGQDMASHRDDLAKLYSRFADIAIDNPHAWKRQAMPAENIRNPSTKNKMLAFPYTKLHNTSWNVDQASALIFCSAEKAAALGIPREKWIFPRASTQSNHMLCVSARRDLSRSVGALIAGQRVLELAGLDISEIDYIDLYSCFPIAVQCYADALGVTADRDYTFSGGMPFAGGPLNNYVLQTTCLLVELLRSHPGRHGLVSSVSGMLTKQGFGIFSSLPSTNGFVFEDVTQAVAELNQPLEVDADYCGEAVIAACTVLFQEDTPWRLVAICDTANKTRTVAMSEDAGLMANAMIEEYCGRNVSVANGRLSMNGH
jgi:acetyl-CoA C-acetyltransferase